MEYSAEDPLAEFVALLKSEGRKGVLGLDCGPGWVGLRFVQAGIHFTGVDPSEENIHAARARGLEASVAAAGSLPFADSTFPSVWAVDALAGLPPEEWDDVVRELGRVAAPGAPIAVVLPGQGAPEGVPAEQVAPEGAPPGFTVYRSPA